MISEPKVFYLTQEWKRVLNSIPLYFGIWPLIVIVLALLAFWTKLGPILAVVLGTSLCVLYLLLSYSLLYFMRRTIKHVLTPEGITFCSIMYCIYTLWENIRGIGRSRLGIYRPPALLLAQPAVKGKVGKGYQSGQAVIQRYRWLITKKDTPDDAIPLLFTVPKNWEESELGLSIRYYVPQIERSGAGSATVKDDTMNETEKKP